MKKIAAVAVILSCFVCGLFAVGTVADDIAFLSPIVGSNPGVTIAGVQSGAAPWLVNHGFAVLNDEGRLRADLRGLILQNLGTPGPVTAVAASVVCGDAVAAPLIPYHSRWTATPRSMRNCTCRLRALV